ncbi:zinc ribbon domain-containing protein [Methanobrevibacter sp.]|uniref:zinc ribbon domain-containing protein n=1 Tax=Methanobrevibacter sp. TaxID=66852 RepID=UPI00388FA8EE
MTKCPKCGEEVEKDSKFCDKCGSKIGNTQEPKNNKNKIIIGLLIIIGILVAAFVLTNVPLFDEEVTLDGVKMTAPAGSTYITKQEGMEFYGSDGKSIFIINNKGMTTEDFDITYSALSTGEISASEFLSMMQQGMDNVTFTSYNLETTQGFKTITVHAEGIIKDTRENVVVKMIKTPNNVYTIFYRENNENSMKMYNSMQLS